MTITWKQLDELRAGDVVELRDSEWPEDNVIRGTVRSSQLSGLKGDLCVGPQILRRRSDGGSSQPNTRTLTFISRAPRPFYINHDRTSPVPGDVVRFEDTRRPGGGSYTNVYLPSFNHDGRPWMSLTHVRGQRYSRRDAEPDPTEGYQVVLLVDGETGEVVP